MKQCKCGRLLLYAEKKYKQEGECHKCYFNRPDKFRLTKGHLTVLYGTYILDESLKRLKLSGESSK